MTDHQQSIRDLHEAIAALERDDLSRAIELVAGVHERLEGSHEAAGGSST